MANHWEQANRDRRVAAMLAFCPAGRTAEENARAADFLATFTPEQRKTWSEGARLTRPPSETTWAQLVEAVRNRPTGDNVEALTVREARAR